MSTSPSSDSFLLKTTEELQYLVQHPELYHPELIAEAGRELRRRGAVVTRPAAAELPAAPSAYEAEPAAAALRSWGPAAAITAAVLGLGWWGLRTGSGPATPPAAPADSKPIVLEAVKVRQLPTFEAEAARQVAATRRQLPAADRADTTATGRFARTARRYWLAENAAAYLTAQALGDSTSSVFTGQIDLTLERITWFMKARAYDQHLHPIMEERLNEMQQGLTLRRSSLKTIKSQYELGAELTNAEAAFTEAAEAADISRVVQGLPSQKAPIAGNLATLGGASKTAPAKEGYTEVQTLPPPRQNQNPLYIIDGEAFPSDPATGEAPAGIQNLPPSAFARIVVVKRQTAVKAFGPRAHDGAVIVVTKAAAARGTGTAL